MKALTFIAGVLAACSSMPRSEVIDHAVYEGVTVVQVREASRVVLEEVTRSPSQTGVWTTDDQVLTEGRIGVCGRDVACGSGTVDIAQNTGTPWTTIKVGLLDRGRDTAVKVAIHYETTSHCGNGSAAVICVPEQLSSTGNLEQHILDEIRARLEATDGVGALLPE